MKFGVLDTGILYIVVPCFASSGLISLDEGFVEWRGDEIYSVTFVNKFRVTFVARCERDQ